MTIATTSTAQSRSSAASACATASSRVAVGKRRVEGRAALCQEQLHLRDPGEASPARRPRARRRGARAPVGLAGSARRWMRHRRRVGCAAAARPRRSRCAGRRRASAGPRTDAELPGAARQRGARQHALAARPAGGRGSDASARPVSGESQRRWLCVTLPMWTSIDPAPSRAREEARGRAKDVVKAAALAGEAVAHARVRQDVARGGGLGLDLAPEVGHVTRSTCVSSS